MLGACRSHPLLRSLRQHVNPLSSFFQQERPLPGLSELFATPEQPLHLDIGCARGKFLLQMASRYPQRNHLGLEIRHPLVKQAEVEREQLELTNLHFLFCNANISLRNWLAQLPIGQLQLVTIQYPDPWFKKRHQKRRMVQPELISWVAGAMAPGAQLFLQSDVPDVTNQMLEATASGPWFEPADGGQWLSDNPLQQPTERELYVLKQGLPVYRRLFVRTTAAVQAHNPCAAEAATP